MSEKEDKKGKNKDDEKAPIIIVKRIKKVGGHHGGAWKIALADFMTAMFCFFLVMWIIGNVSEDTKKGLAEYFSPVIASRNYSSGSGGLLSGTVFSNQGGFNENRAQSTGNKSSDEVERERQEKMREELDKEDGGAFEDAAENIMDGLEGLRGLEKINESLLIDVTHEGLRIQITDAKDREMFKSGSAEPQPHAIEIIKIISDVIKELPNKISVRGHTDSTPLNSKDGKYTNWELSSDRAQTLRRLMQENGITEDRIMDVQGRADREPLDKNDTASIRNRRVSLILMRQSVIKAETEKAEKYQQQKLLKKREKGVIYFP